MKRNLFARLLAFCVALGSVCGTVFATDGSTTAIGGVDLASVCAWITEKADWLLVKAQPYIDQLPPHWDLYAAAALLVLSGLTILVVLAQKRKYK